MQSKESGLIIVGSLRPERKIQDRERVFAPGGMSGTSGNGLQGSNKSYCGIYDPYCRAVYKNISPALLASDHKHNKCVIEEVQGERQ